MSQLMFYIFSEQHSFIGWKPNQTKGGHDGADVLRGRYFASSSPPSLPCIATLYLGHYSDPGTFLQLTSVYIRIGEPCTPCHCSPSSMLLRWVSWWHCFSNSSKLLRLWWPKKKEQKIEFVLLRNDWNNGNALEWATKKSSIELQVRHHICVR